LFSQFREGKTKFNDFWATWKIFLVTPGYIHHFPLWKKSFRRPCKCRWIQQSGAPETAA